jgi:hypothetical protein
MTTDAVVVFTSKSIETIFREGGSAAWRVDRNHARPCSYAVCTRNANSDWVEGPEPHHSAFLIGKVKDVVPASDQDGRYLIEFSEVARVNIPDVWKGDRNPVRYSTLDDLGIDPATLPWEPMPEVTDERSNAIESAVASNGTTRPLTIADAKKGLALTLGVAPEAIEITIRA